MDEEVRAVGEHRGVGAHAAARLVDAPALAGGVARPHERDRAPLGRRGAEVPDHRLAEDGRRGEILELDAIEDVRPGRQVLEQHLGGEIAFRQRVDIACRRGCRESCRRSRPPPACGRAGRCAPTRRPKSAVTSPDCRPCVMRGRSAARLTAGRAIPPSAVSPADAAPATRSRRRVSAGVCRTWTGQLASCRRIRCGGWRRFLTTPLRLCDSCVTRNLRGV